MDQQPKSRRAVPAKNGPATNELMTATSHPSAPRASRLTAEAFRLALVALTHDEFAEWISRERRAA